MDVDHIDRTQLAGTVVNFKRSGGSIVPAKPPAKPAYKAAKPRAKPSTKSAAKPQNRVKRGMMLNLMPIPDVFQMNEIIPTGRTCDHGGRTTLVMAENHIKTTSSGLQYQA